ncbi:MAG: SAM-dependent methyltransferase [Deltaproteobacteria bacterium]|nr:SAM-dependent methyltransferase [Deltaproteobacteria bacterium]
MAASNSISQEPAYKDQFMTLLKDSLVQNRFVKLILGKYRGQDSSLNRILVRNIVIKGEQRLSMIYCYKTREVTKNETLASGMETVHRLLGDPFMSAHLFSLTGDIQIEFSRKGKCRLISSKATHNTVPSERHDRDKKRLIDPDNPFLTVLGITDEEHRIIPAMARKWKQIHKFLEIFQHAFESSRISKTNGVHVVDFGCGKGYLTFAMHDLLRNSLDGNVQVTGVELREDLVRFCNEAAKNLAIDSLSFYQGDVSSYSPEIIHIMIALHACDTATDQAIYLGIRSNAEIIMCAPCCHKQIREQIRIPAVIEPMLKFGVHLGQEAEMVTDSLRALLLEASGYTTQLLEFVSLEHTSKNKMLLAIKRDTNNDREHQLTKIEKLKDFYGIREHCLETLLNTK